ncbi:MAG: SEC-C metal-binding domain-containing protein, partial [Nitrospinaceae bacterium]
HPRLTEIQTEIARGFAKNAADELILLFKQRVVEAKAYGEKNPTSYLEFEPGNYFNYFELVPKNKEMLDFNFSNEQYFAEDSYDIDPRNDNRSLKLAFYKLELDNADQAPIFSSTYFLDERLREKEDAKLESSNSDMLIAINESIPDFNDRLKKRYKEAKRIGKELLKSSPGVKIEEGKIKSNEPCPCGSGKKYKKCCALKLN